MTTMSDPCPARDGETPPPDDTPVWLIERGGEEGYAFAGWWVARNSWTHNASKAAWFRSIEAAQAKRREFGIIDARVTQHVFCSRPERPAPARDGERGDVRGVADARLQSRGYPEGSTGHITDPSAPASDGETLEAGYVAMNTDSLVGLLRLLAEKQRQTKDAALLRACARRLHALYHADYSDD